MNNPVDLMSTINFEFLYSADKYLERSKPIFEILGSSSVLCGDIGAGNFTKLANQIIVGANIHALSEALVLTTKAGLDPETVFNAIKGII